MSAAVKPRKAKPRTTKPHPSAFLAETPCEHCGCEWQRTAINRDTLATYPVCANLWCPVIRQLLAWMVELAKLSADSPQFDNPLDAARAIHLRDAVLSGKLTVKVGS